MKCLWCARLLVLAALAYGYLHLVAKSAIHLGKYVIR